MLSNDGHFNPRIYFFKIFIVYILILAPRVCQAQEKKAERCPTTIVDQDVLRGINLLYNWEFDTAENIFCQLIEKRPNDPIGYFYFAMVSWSRLASGFWSAEMVKEYGERIDRAISTGKRAIKEKQDCFDYLYLGGALGFKGRFQLMERKWLPSFFLALEAIDALKTSLEMCPENKDVLFGLGIFDYYTARLSGVLRFLSYLLIHKGDKEEGLRKLEVAAAEAVYSSTEAKSLLLHIYLFMEKDGYHKALPIARELALRFKENPRYKFLEGVTYIRLGIESRYREVIDFLRAKSREQNSVIKSSIWANRARYLDASYALFHDQCSSARSILGTILASADPISDPAMATWPLLKIGMSYDMEEQREKAVDYYNRVLKLKNGGGAQFLAEKYLEAPARKKNLFIGY